ncbi:MAG TPA: hypothetical protein VGN95_10340 [Pyrinomonadaceae bacterium]|jgi:hypothetical protein|nr:hypothetical protein [Pyrinomonadaceae bacterium]
MKVNAAQHVSGILTSKQSPRCQAGYQTIFYTRELLSPEEMRVIERHVQYSSARDDKAKWQSYRLTPRRHVISRIIPIPEPDEFGRRGRFFTYSLIFDAPGGQQFDDVLFDLLRPQNFLLSLDKVLASDGLKTGHVSPLSLDAKKEWVNEAASLLRDWSGEQLSQMYLLMSNPGAVIEQGQHVALVGSEAQILDALKVAFLLTPANARQFCSFDTNAASSEAPPDMFFWGRGVPAAGVARYVIDAARRQVAIQEPSPLRIDGFSLGQLSAPLRKAIATQLSQPSADMLQCLINRKYKTFMGEPIYRTLLHGTELSLTASDLELLTSLGQTHHGLGLLLAMQSGNESQRLQMLAAMDSHAYKQRVRELRTRPDFKPWQVFSPIFMLTWFALFRGDYSMSDLTCAIAQVAEHGSAQDRKYVEDIHEHLNPAQRQELGDWLKASPYRLERLQAALDKPFNKKARASSIGKSSSLLRRLRHPFGK